VKASRRSFTERRLPLLASINSPLGKRLQRRPRLSVKERPRGGRSLGSNSSGTHSCSCLPGGNTALLNRHRSSLFEGIVLISDCLWIGCIGTTLSYQRDSQVMDRLRASIPYVDLEVHTASLSRFIALDL
jgi:hypothetical protein